MSEIRSNSKGLELLESKFNLAEEALKAKDELIEELRKKK